LQAGQNIRLYVTASDGDLTAKFEVFADILKEQNQLSTPSFPGSKKNSLGPPGFPALPNFNQRPPPVPKNPPPSISNNPPPRPHFQQKSRSNASTLLRPIRIEDVKNELSEETTTTRRTTTEADLTTQNYTGNGSLYDQAVKSPPDLTVTVVPIISVCAVFLMVGIIAAVFRKKIHLGKPKGSKDDIVSGNIL
jgi:hypothetical protein